MMHRLACLAAAAFVCAQARVAAQATLPAGVIERELSVTGGPVSLPGTLTLPEGKGPFPALIIVHGSGAGDRNGTLGPNAPYRDIAWGLAAQGVAVYRYDKRAMAHPMWYANRVFTVYEEVTQDALNALSILRAQPEVDARRTFLIGHSLGGMLAPRLAHADGKLAGIIIMAGATQAKIPDQMERQFAYLIGQAGADSALVRAQIAPLVEALATLRALTPADSLDERPIPGLGGTGPKYWLDLNAYDPAASAKTLRIPILVLQGMRDYQVTPVQLDEWLKAYGSTDRLTVKRYPSLNHLFISGEGVPAPAEYAKPGQVAAETIADIARFVKQ